MRTYRPTYKVDGVVHTSRRWWIDLRDHRGIRRRLAGLPDRRTTEGIGRNIERLVGYRATGEPPNPALAKWLESLPSKLRKILTDIGLLDRARSAASRLLTEHLDGEMDLPGFRQSFIAKGATTLYISVVMSRTHRIIDGCGFKYWNDICPSKVMAFLDSLRGGEKGIGAQTFNSYLIAFKLFCSWMVREGRATKSPVEHLRGLNVRTDRRHDRRALSVEELSWLLNTTRKGPVHHGMTGTERVMLYKLDLETGLRARELAHLTPESFTLDVDYPVVRVKPAYSKRRREDVLPLRTDTATELRSFLADKPPGAPVFNMRLGRMAAMLRLDLAAARQAWLDEARSPQERLERDDMDFLVYRDRSGHVADFHALRHTCGSLLVSAGVHPKVAQTILRHSDINMTLSRYSHVFANQMAAAVAALPSLGKPSKLATAGWAV